MDQERPVALALLGGWELTVGATTVSVGLRQQRLIAALAIFGRRSRAFLGGLLWPECNDAHAMGSLRAAVFTVSRRVPGVLSCCGRDLCLGDGVDVDLHHVRRALASTVRGSPPADPWWFTDSAHADLLPGWYDDWVVVEQQHLRDHYLDAAERLAAAALDRHDHYQALHLAHLARELDPLRESPVSLLLRAQLELGNEVTALAIFREYATVLDEQLGARPSARITGLVEALRQQQGREGGRRAATGRGTAQSAAVVAKRMVRA